MKVKLRIAEHVRKIHDFPQRTFFGVDAFEELIRGVNLSSLDHPKNFCLNFKIFNLISLKSRNLKFMRVRSLKYSKENALCLDTHKSQSHENPISIFFNIINVKLHFHIIKCFCLPRKVSHIKQKMSFFPFINHFQM